MKVFKINDKVISRINSAGNKVALAPQPEPEKPYYILATFNDSSIIPEDIYGNRSTSSDVVKFEKEKISDYVWKFTWPVDNSLLTSLDSIFSTSGTSVYYNNMTELDLTGISDDNNISSLMQSFRLNNQLKSIKLFNTHNVTNLEETFYGCYNLESVINLDTPKVNTMKETFHYCQKLVNITDIDISRVTTMQNSFNGCSSLVNLTTTGYAYNLTSFTSAFNRCTSLENVLIKRIGNHINFGNSSKLSKESVLYMFNNLQTLSTKKAITLNSSVYNKLTSDEIAIAKGKGWNVVSA